MEIAPAVTSTVTPLDNTAYWNAVAPFYDDLYRDSYSEAEDHALHTPGSWEKLAMSLYNGDPWSNYNQDLDPLDPRELNPAKRGWYDGKKRGRMTF